MIFGVDKLFIGDSQVSKIFLGNEEVYSNTPPLMLPIGGRIFYDDGDNGATYTFYDASGNKITNTSISGLANAVGYTVSGTPTKDRFYVFDNTSHTTGGSQLGLSN